MAGSGSPDTETWIVIASFDAEPGREPELAAVLARYVVLSRGEPGCRNIDLATGVGGDGRFVVVGKWDSADAPRRHLDGPAAVTMATAVRGLVRRPPSMELYLGVSAHDLR